MVSSVIGIGLKGIQQATERAVKHANQVSKAFEPGAKGEGDLIEGGLGLKQDLRDVQASRKIIETGDKLSQAVLDILA